MHTLKELVGGIVDLAHRHPVYTPDEYLASIDDMLAEFQESGKGSVRLLGAEGGLVSISYEVASSAVHASFRMIRHGRKGYVTVYRSELALARRFVRAHPMVATLFPGWDDPGNPPVAPV